MKYRICQSRRVDLLHSGRELWEHMDNNSTNDA
jgi:hypothetical protein